MGGFSVSSFLKLSLSFTFLILSLLITACGKQTEAPRAGAVEPVSRSLGVATPSKALLADWKKDGVPETCFKVMNNGSTLNQLYAFNTSCELATGVKPFAVFEAREWINPDKISEPTGEFILYAQYLPVGELRMIDGQWSLEDLCQLDSFYRSACKLTVAENRVTGIDLNATASADRVRLQKTLEAENEGLKIDLETSSASLVKLNALLAKVSGQVQSQKDGVQAVVSSFEPVLQKEEGRVNEILVGRKGQPGIEARLATIALEVRALSASLEAVQKETGGATAPYLAKLQEVRDLEKSLESLYVERSALKAKLAAAESEEQAAASMQNLDKVNSQIGETALKIADGKDDAAALLKAVKAHPSYEKEVEAAKQLADAKKRAGEALDRVALVRAKLNAIQVAKSHVATASKLLRENKVGEAAMVLPSLGKFVDRAVSIVI